MFKRVLPLSLIIGFRFFGLFIVMPTIAVYAINMEGSNSFLAGVVIGGYALTQLLFQIPFGIMSDRVGRKVTIFIGLVLFLIGSLICAFSTDIYMLILGRLLQGSGAIAAVISAMVADMTSESERTKAMAIMGGIIASSFMLALIVGPLIGGAFGMDKLFLIAGVLSIISMFLLLKVKQPEHLKYSYIEDRDITNLLKDKNLNILNITNFLQKAFMTLAFFIIPLSLTQNFEFAKEELYKIYIPATILGILAMGIGAMSAEKKGRFNQVLIAGVILFAIAFILFNSHSEIIFIIGAMLFFIGFNMHEPIMQSMASRFAKANQKGTALGIFNSFGYIGTFIGGVIGAVAIKNYLILSILITIISLIWVLLILKLDSIKNRKVIYLEIGEYSNNGVNSLRKIDGVIEYYFNDTTKTLIIRYDETIIAREKLEKSCK